jgi:hypothetical protein
VGPRQHPAAQLSIALQVCLFHDLDHWLDLGVAELADEVLALALACARRPTEEHIAGCLHDALANHHALSRVGKRAGATVRLQDRLARLLELQEMRVAIIRA